MRLAQAGTADDYRRIARRRLPRFLFDYIDGAANGELTTARNRADLNAAKLEQRVMVDTSRIDTSTELFGQAMAMPVLLGPVGLGGLLARRGEVQAAAAASAAKIPFCLSTLGLCGIDEVARVNPDSWFQLYMMRDRVFMAELIAHVQAAGAPVLILTVDCPVSGVRYRDRRSGLALSHTIPGFLQQAAQILARPGWLYDVQLRGRPLIFGSVASAKPNARTLGDFWQWLNESFDASLSWTDLDFIRQHWRGPIVVKGILHPSDARAAVDAGADAVVVSNHGGRQLDGVDSTIATLPAIVDAVKGQVPVMIDGGIASGIDVMKALTRGASACLLGRAWAFALAAGGSTAISQMLSDMHNEIRVALALTGHTKLPNAGVVSRPQHRRSKDSAVARS
jgi:L-lactate dehydrogenase (cytochrome)